MVKAKKRSPLKLAQAPVESGVYEWIKEEAAKEDRSIASMIRKLIAEAMAVRQQK